MNGAILLIIGLGIGIGIGLVIGALRINAERGKVALLEKQIEEFRAEENRLTSLNEQLKAVTSGMSALSTQAQEAELKRTRAEGEIRTQIENMKLGNENLLRETTKLAGALSNSQTRGK
ncbi:MAG: DNA recombination protein RmuC, partial [Actinobacteria bacterium]|nr:DNA recombination protein RmuC [Actinomycetota bacterium]